MCRYIVELIERTQDNGLRQRFIKADTVTVPRNKSVVYFCVFDKENKHGFSSIKSVVQWGGTSGYFYARMFKESTPEKEIEQIKSKRVVLL